MIFHLTTPDEWAGAQRRGEVRAASLETEGFVHCSYRDQVLGSAGTHFAGNDSLIVLEIDEAALGPGLKVEPSRGGALFPHVYGAIPLSAVTGQVTIHRDAAGSFQWPSSSVGSVPESPAAP